MTWPTECPKCGAADPTWITGIEPFYMTYCDGISRASTACAFGGWSTGKEHLHHACQRCGFEIITPCKDAGEEPGNAGSTKLTDNPRAQAEQRLARAIRLAWEAPGPHRDWNIDGYHIAAKLAAEEIEKAVMADRQRVLNFEHELEPFPGGPIQATADEIPWHLVCADADKP